MKKIILSILYIIIFPLATNADVVINEQNFPDPVFREFIRTNYGNANGILTNDVILKTSGIIIDDGNEISSIKGIEFFTSIEAFSFMGIDSPLSSVDLSLNTNLNMVTIFCKISSLNISSCINLTYLSLQNVNITSLDLSNNTKLVNLGFRGCKQHVFLDLSNNLSLKSLSISNINVGGSLENIIIPNTVKNGLTSLAITQMDNINNLNLTSFPHLKRLSLEKLNLSSLTISNFQDLYYFRCPEGQLDQLNVSNMPSLRTIICNGNKLTNLNISNCPNLEGLNCSSNMLTSLNLSGFQKMMQINCENNNFKELDVSGKPNLTLLHCEHNSLRTLNLTGDTKLRDLTCNDNELTTLDLSTNTMLVEVSIQRNKLSSLFLSTNRESTSGCWVWCYYNKLGETEIAQLLTSVSNRGYLGLRIDIINSAEYVSPEGVIWHEENEISADLLSLISPEIQLWDTNGNHPVRIDENYFTNISLPKAERKNSYFYDLSGKRMKKQPQKGIYIKNGRKVIR